VRQALDVTSSLVGRIERLEGKPAVANEVAALRQEMQNVLSVLLATVRSVE
jgi:hypothetical protein